MIKTAGYSIIEHCAWRVIRTVLVSCLIYILTPTFEGASFHFVPRDYCSILASINYQTQQNSPSRPWSMRDLTDPWEAKGIFPIWPHIRRRIETWNLPSAVHWYTGTLHSGNFVNQIYMPECRHQNFMIFFRIPQLLGLVPYPTRVRTCERDDLKSLFFRLAQ